MSSITPVQHNTTQYNSKASAIEANSPTYNTGRKCRAGHLSDRYTSNGMCIECLRNHRIKSGSLAKKAKIAINNLQANDMVKGEVWVPRKETTILHTITRLLNSPQRAQVVTWLRMIDEAPMGAPTLTLLFDYYDGAVHADYMAFPQRHDDAGILQIELTPDAWYVASEVMEVLRGERAHCCRVWS